MALPFGNQPRADAGATGGRGHLPASSTCSDVRRRRVHGSLAVLVVLVLATVALAALAIPT